VGRDGAKSEALRVSRAAKRKWRRARICNSIRGDAAGAFRIHIGAAWAKSREIEVVGFGIRRARLRSLRPWTPGGRCLGSEGAAGTSDATLREPRTPRGRLGGVGTSFTSRATSTTESGGRNVLTRHLTGNAVRHRGFIGGLGLLVCDVAAGTRAGPGSSCVFRPNPTHANAS
jgi:hypothetical protein